MIPVLIVFVTLGSLYRLVMWLMSKARKSRICWKASRWQIVEEGQLGLEKVRSANMTEFEFFMELRLNSVEQLGQVRLAIMEMNGRISVYYYDDDDVKPVYAFCRMNTWNALPPSRRQESTPVDAVAMF